MASIGGAIHHIGNIHKYARKEDVPEHTVFVIITDGKVIHEAVASVRESAVIPPEWKARIEEDARGRK